MILSPSWINHLRSQEATGSLVSDWRDPKQSVFAPCVVPCGIPRSIGPCMSFIRFTLLCVKLLGLGTEEGSCKADRNRHMSNRDAVRPQTENPIYIITIITQVWRKTSTIVHRIFFGSAQKAPPKRAPSEFT